MSNEEGTGNDSTVPLAVNEDELEEGSNFLVKDRSCTDSWCILVFLAAFAAFVFVTFLGLQDGDPRKLYLPRDYSGSYCDADSNWGTGYKLQGFPVLSYTMNVTSTTDLVVKELICSYAARDALVGGSTPLLTSVSEQQAYLCHCCLAPCAKCTGSYKTTKLKSGGVQGVISGKMSEITGVGGDLFNPSGFNSDFFTNIWSEATRYFNLVCLPDCDTGFATLNGTNDARRWIYEMAPDNPLSPYWAMLNTSGPPEIQATIASAFTFTALPASLCAYPASKCIPMPGVQLTAGMPGHCSLGLTGAVQEQLGAALSDAFGSVGSEAFQKEFASFQNFGSLFGEAFKTGDTFVTTAVSCLIIGFAYILLLRFLVGICVWTALFAMLLLFALGGGVVYASSSQCQGTDLLDTSYEMAVAAATSIQHYSTTLVQQTVDGKSWEVPSETVVGDGANYTGMQRRSVEGYSCIQWGLVNTLAENYSQATFPDSNLSENFCRNPYNASTATEETKASTIWCFTSDDKVTWQECRPIGVIRPVCKNGYAVADEGVRTLLEYAAYALWILGVLYLFLVLCFCSRIRLAIAVNKVAATFVAQTPQVMLVPVIQALVAVMWIGLWILCSSFLLSQVPDDYTPTDAYATYAEAYGTAETPGRCTDKWPTGFTYKDDDNCVNVNGTAHCWKCGQPRFAFDWRFACSFFVFLWNNALNIAFGQFMIAGSVAAWFFTPNRLKGKRGSVKKSAYFAFRFHFGSLAFGSFIIAVVQFVRYMLLYLEKQAQAQKNRVMALILRVLRCCMWCLENFLKFLNKNAYIQIAIRGTNFCTAAKEAFMLIVANVLRFGAVALLGTVINFIGYIFIIAATVAVGYLQLTAMHPNASPVVPVAMYVACGYVVARLCMNVFELAVDTMLQCFLVCEQEKDKIGDSDFVPSQMRGWLAGKADETPSIDKE
ncbi:slc44a2 [Symbiodinium natans]|uniref:Slc44a2 protein n=1 Tax=Symbiodinium natans TaxID=878477 RepID=A0A812QJ23_9DINO|nr:slc44a2 [Symbiodinium natans]